MYNSSQIIWHFPVILLFPWACSWYLFNKMYKKIYFRWRALLNHWFQDMRCPSTKFSRKLPHHHILLLQKGGNKDHKCLKCQRGFIFCHYSILAYEVRYRGLNMDSKTTVERQQGKRITKEHICCLCGTPVFGPNNTPHLCGGGGGGGHHHLARGGGGGHGNGG